MTTRVLVADALVPESFDDLRASGVDVQFRSELTSADLPSAIAGFKVLVVRSTEVTAATFEAADRLALVVRAGSGTNTIDVAAASARGIFVANCPGKNSVAVAELAIGLILAIDRRIADNVIALRDGRWNKKDFSAANGIKGSRLGLVGFGSIAREVARRARAFGMHVTAFSRSLTEEVAEAHGVARGRSLVHLFRDNDIVSLHLPLTGDTRGIVDRHVLSVMPQGAMLINTARAEVVDCDALLEFTKAGRIRVGTDVFAHEPESKQGDFADPLGALPNVVGTHHIGASTTQAQNEIGAETVRIVRNFCETGEVISPVNVNTNPAVDGTVVVRHRDRVGVLASVLSTIKKAAINVETMENIVFSGGEAACARIRVTRWPDKALIAELQNLENIIHVEVV